MCSDNEIKEVLGKNIRNERLRNNLSQEELAEKVSLSVQFIRDIEAGRNLGSITTLLNLCSVLNTTPNRIFRDLLESNDSIEKNLSEKISLLDEHDKNIIITLLDNMNKI